MSSVSLQKYRYQDDETPPIDPSPGHMTHGRSTELSHAHLDGYTHPAALTVRAHTRTHTHTHAHTHTHTHTHTHNTSQSSTIWKDGSLSVLRRFYSLSEVLVFLRRLQRSLKTRVPSRGSCTAESIGHTSLPV